MKKKEVVSQEDYAAWLEETREASAGVVRTAQAD